MKTRMNFLLLALMICTFVSCADNVNFEPEEQAQKREQLREKLSHEVTQAEARENLEKIILDLKIPSTRGGDTNSLPPITSVYTRGKAAVATRAGEEVEPYFHIFNFGDNEGFAIMSGDDRVEPLLALTTKGEFNPDEDIDNPGFEIAYSRMGDYYVQQVSSRGLTPGGIEIPPKDSIPAPVFNLDSNVYHINCPVNWHQDRPYNEFCESQDGQEAYTGCAPVALAQFMAIYKYPNSYRYFPHSPEQFFNWDDMTSQTPSSQGFTQIAKLMWLLGQPNNLCVQYRSVLSQINDNSGSSAANVLTTFANFGYQGGDRIDYDTDSVVAELSQGYPILIRGEKGSGGHIWLAHGVKEYISTFSFYHLSQGWITNTTTSYMIYCNWGWRDGDKNGYYLSGVFDLAGNGTSSFPDQLEAFINIRKPN